MVNKPRKVAFVGGINNLAFGRLHQVSTSRTAVFLHPLSTYFGVDRKHLSDILHNKFPFFDSLASTQSPALSSCGKRVYDCVLMVLELSILAKDPASTGFIVTLRGDHPVYALLHAVVGNVGMKVNPECN